MATIKYPTGSAETLTLSATGAQALTINNSVTVIDGVTNSATGNRTINLTVNGEIKAGAKILVKVKTTGTQTTTFGTGFTAPVITGVAGKTFTQGFSYDGTTFYPDGTAVQVD